VKNCYLNAKISIDNKIRCIKDCQLYLPIAAATQAYPSDRRRPLSFDYLLGSPPSLSPSSPTTFIFGVRHISLSSLSTLLV
jgi:hypothetical protein